MLSVDALKKNLTWTEIDKIGYIFSSCWLKHKYNLEGIINFQVLLWTWICKWKIRKQFLNDWFLTAAMDLVLSIQSIALLLLWLLPFSHLLVCFLSVIFNRMPFWLKKIGWYTALMKMLDKCSFLELTWGMLYKTFLNMLAAALNVMKSWKLEVLHSLCGQLRTVFSMLPSFAVNFKRNHFSWIFLGTFFNMLIIPTIRKIILIFWGTSFILGGGIVRNSSCLHPFVPH